MVKPEIYADGADLRTMQKLRDRVAGFTTNPSLMRKAGVTDYHAFAEVALAAAGGKPISFEVFGDDTSSIQKQARMIDSWGPNIYVKVPIVHADGRSAAPVIGVLASQGIRVNVTAVLTKAQARDAIEALGDGVGIVSIFAGRIADAGRDPMRTMNSARARIKSDRIKLLWASVREVYNYVQAQECGCDIITMTPDMIAKLDGLGRDLDAYTVETVKQFQRDAEGITL